MDNNKIVEGMFTLLPYWHYNIDRVVKQIVKNAGISFEAYYCLQVLQREGALTMSQLSLYQRISKQQATRMIENLYAHGFVNRIYDESDRRIIRIQITDKAIAFVNEHIHGEKSFLKELEEKLNKEDIDKLYEAIQMLQDVLPKMG